MTLGCGGREAVQCDHDSNCDLSGGGHCIFELYNRALSLAEIQMLVAM